MGRLLAGLILILTVAAGCAQPLPVITPTPPPQAEPAGGQAIDAAAWAAAMCQAVDQLDQAVGDPTTGQRSAAWQDFETALTGADPDQLEAGANGVLGHLTDGSRSAQAATRFPEGSAAASEMQALLDGLAEGVRALRDGTLAGDVAGVDRGRRLIDAAYEEHYEQALGQMGQVPLGGVLLPCRPT